MNDKPKVKRTRKFRAKPNGASELEAMWREHGSDAIRLVAEKDPGAYIAAIARLIEDID